MVKPMATGSSKLSAMVQAGIAPCFSTLPPHATMAEAVSAMLRMNHSAVAVMDGSELIGIVTRTDLLRALDPALQGRSDQMPLSGVMTKALVTAGPAHSFEQALEQMHQSRIEHLPVLEEQRLVTVLHQRELMQHQIEALNTDINYLQEYIEGLHHAEQD